MLKTIRERLKIYKLVMPFFKQKYKMNAVELVLLRIIQLGLAIATPYLYKVFIDDVLIRKRIESLKWVIGGYILFYVLDTLGLTLQRVISNKLKSRIIFDIRLKVWKDCLKMSPTLRNSYNAGDLKNRIESDVDAYDRLIGQQILDYVYNWIVAGVISVVLLVYNWKLALIGFIMVPVSFWMANFMSKGVSNSSEAIRESWGGYESYLQNSIQGWKEVKALTSEKKVIQVFTSYWHSFSRNFFRMQMYICGNKAFVALKDSFVTQLNLYFIGAFLIFNGELTIGGLLVFMQYYGMFSGAVNSIVGLEVQLGSDRPSLTRVKEILDSKGEQYEKPQASMDFKGCIEFKNISFRYNENNDEVLKEVNLKIRPRERIAIVGRSGCGKTTLVKILLGLYKPKQGEVFIDGRDIHKINPVYLHKNIGVVMQDSILFNMSIKNNLLLARPSASDEQIREACRLAYIDEFITSLPDGYKTVIGEKGSKLSGGQRQRLVIARVLLSDPDIVIFDEATSSLDYESEKMILKTIDTVAKEKTTIVIAHRLSSILSADRVVVMDRGKIVDVGHHRELYKNSSFYNALFKEQYMAQKTS